MEQSWICDGDADHILNFQSTGLVKEKPNHGIMWPGVLASTAANRADWAAQCTPPSGENPQGRDGVSQKPANPPPSLLFQALAYPPGHSHLTQLRCGLSTGIDTIALPGPKSLINMFL